MADMELGTEAITRAPNRMNRVIVAKRKVSSVETFASVAVFSWGAVLVGERVFMEWDYMPATLFDTLQALYVADAEVEFDPQDGEGLTFQVEIMDFDGTYYQTRASGADVWRRNVRLELLIMAEN